MSSVAADVSQAPDNEEIEVRTIEQVLAPSTRGIFGRRNLRRAIDAGLRGWRPSRIGNKAGGSGNLPVLIWLEDSGSSNKSYLSQTVMDILLYAERYKIKSAVLAETYRMDVHELRQWWLGASAFWADSETNGPFAQYLFIVQKGAWLTKAHDRGVGYEQLAACLNVNIACTQNNLSALGSSDILGRMTTSYVKQQISDYQITPKKNRQPQSYRDDDEYDLVPDFDRAGFTQELKQRQVISSGTVQIFRLRPDAKEAPELAWILFKNNNKKEYAPKTLRSVARWVVEGDYNLDIVADLYKIGKTRLRKECRAFLMSKAIDHGEVSDNGFSYYYRLCRDDKWVNQALMVGVDVEELARLYETNVPDVQKMAKQGDADHYQEVLMPGNQLPQPAYDKIPVSASTGKPIGQGSAKDQVKWHICSHVPNVTGAPKIVWLQSDAGDRKYRPRSMREITQWGKATGRDATALADLYGTSAGFMKDWIIVCGQDDEIRAQKRDAKWKRGALASGIGEDALERV